MSKTQLVQNSLGSGVKALFHAAYFDVLAGRVLMTGESWFIIDDKLDLIYYGPQMKGGYVYGFIKQPNLSVYIMLRKCGFQVICLVDDCMCGLKIALNGKEWCKSSSKHNDYLTFSEDGKFKDHNSDYKYVIFETFLRIGVRCIVDRLVFSDVGKGSGFGYLVRDVVKRYLVRSLIHEQDTIHLGSEFESLVKFGIKSKHYGTPVYRKLLYVLDLSRCDKRQIKILSDRLGGLVTLSEVSFEFGKFKKTIELEYEFMTSDESYLKYKDKYPKQYNKDSINVGFKYSTFLGWRDVLKDLFMDEGCTVQDVGCGNLVKFMIDIGIDVRIPAYDKFIVDDSIKRLVDKGVIVRNLILDPLWSRKREVMDWGLTNITAGYRSVYVFMPKDFESSIWLKIVVGKSLALYLLQNATLDNKMVQLENIAMRKHIINKRFIKVLEEGIMNWKFVVCNFALSNLNNQSILDRFLAGLKFTRGYLILMPGNPIKAEGTFEENGYKDFTVSSLQIAKLGYHFIDFRSFMLMCMPKYLEFKDELISYDFGLNEDLKWGFITSELKYFEQSVLTSPTIRIKYISEWVRREFSLTKNDMYMKRVIYLRNVMFDNTIESAFDKNKGFWSLAYRIKDNGEYEFLDISGHVINLFFYSECFITEIIKYLQMKQTYMNNFDYRDKEGIFGTIQFNDQDWKYEIGNLYNELRGVEGFNRSKLVWHTPVEDYQAFGFIPYIIQDLSLGFNILDVTLLRDLWDGLIYPKDKLSLSVANDKRIVGQ